MKPTSVIIGCGYLGECLAAQLSSEGRQVFVTARSARRLSDLETRLGVLGVQFDTGASISPLPVLELAAGAALEVYCLLTPSALASDAARERLLEFMAQLPVRRALLTSSTGIYSARSGEIVTAESGIAPQSERERRLLGIEEAWLRASVRFVVRLAGLYGAGRVIGAKSLREGALIPGRQSALLNLIHRSDAVSLLRACMNSQRTARIEVGSDGTPVGRGEYYRYLAALLHAPAPRFDAPDAPDAPGDGGKAVNPKSTMDRLTWRPAFPSFREGLAEALACTTAE